MGERELLILLLAGLFAPASSQIRKLLFVEAEKSWSEAQSYCRERYTDLVTVDSQDEAELLFTAEHSLNDAAWIGLYRDTPNWQWSNSDDVIYTNWRADLFCASVNSQGEWEDLVCSEKKAFMCFKETSNITERYTLIEELKTWTEAQQYCREHHTDLVSIKSASENGDLVKKAQGKPFWIGLFNNAWKWSRQSYNYIFHNWDNEEPNNVGGSEGCVVMDYNGTWKDVSCSSKFPFICCYATGSFLIYNTDHNKCVDAISSSSVVASPCNPDAKSQQFRWVSEYRLQSVSLELCLGVASKTDWVRILLYPCDEKNELQQWECRDEDLFAIQGANLFLNYGNTNDGKVILYHGSGPWSRWSIYGTDVDLCSRLSRSHEDGLCSFEETEETWHDAQSYCRNQSKELVTIQYQARMNETLDLLNSTGSWIGLYHDKENWQWSKGDAFIYYNWRSVQFCASVNSEGEWEDRACSETTRFMCYSETSNITARYTLIEELKNWTEAQQYCREHHTDLVSIKNASENEDLVKKAQGKTFWIGLFNNPWKWSHQGDNYTFHSWNTGEPNNVGGNENCVIIGVRDGQNQSRGEWHDKDCSLKLPFFCFDDVRDLVLEKENKTWGEAVVHCRAQHRELASIVSEKEQRYAAHLSKRANSPLVWIGLRQSRLFGFWFWMNSEPLDYTKWKGGVQPPGYPDSSPCVAMTTGSDPHWTDKPCAEKLNFFCF